MSYEYNKLKGRIIELYKTRRNFAEVLGISENSMSLKLNCKTAFDQKDIIKWAELLRIPKEDYSDYFFT